MFSRRKICVCQFPLWEAFSKNGSFVNVFETSFFESPLCFSLCDQKNLDMIFFFSLPLLQSVLILHFLFSPLVFFLDVLFNDPCLQEKTKKCFSLSISQARNFSLKKVCPLFGKIVFSSFLFEFVFEDKCFRFLFQHFIFVSLF